jgi:hypothetical protein
MHSTGFEFGIAAIHYQLFKTVATFAFNGGTIDSSIDSHCTYGYLFSVEIPTVGGAAD